MWLISTFSGFQSIAITRARTSAWWPQCGSRRAANSWVGWAGRPAASTTDDHAAAVGRRRHSRRQSAPCLPLVSASGLAVAHVLDLPPCGRRGKRAAGSAKLSKPMDAEPQQSRAQRDLPENGSISPSAALEKAVQIPDIPANEPGDLQKCARGKRGEHPGVLRRWSTRPP